MKGCVWLGLTFTLFTAATAQDTIPPETGRHRSITVKRDDVIARDTLSGLRMHPLKTGYYQSLGIACKVELRLEQATGIPFRFRLGSLAQTEYMEQKPNAVKP
jgi:hypothetical protein